MKAPKNFYNTVDQRKLGLEDGLLPNVTAADNGKILKVTEGKWGPGDDENTIIEANPETGTASEELENLKIGDTIYSVNKPTFEYIKGIRLTISDGGQYRTDKPKVEFYDDGGNLITTPTYTSSCDKEYAGNISLNQVCSIATTDAPGIFTYVFDTTMPVTINHLIKLTNSGAFAGDIAKSVKVELTSDGENWLELWFDPSIAWSGSSNAYRIIDIKTGEVSNTLLPIVTSADNGKVLGVVSGVWDKMNVPTELPSVTTENNKKYLEVVGGVWSVSETVRFIRIIPTISAVTCTDNQDGTFTYDFTFSNITTRNEDNKNIDLSSGIKVDFDTIISIADPSGCVAIAFPNCSASASFKYSNLSYRVGYTPYIATLIKGSVKSSIDKIGIATIDTINATSMSITIRT